MRRAVIKRYFSKDIFPTIKTDFRFLVRKIRSSGFEYDLQIRDDYFNLYYRGNNLGKVSYKKNKERYAVEIHRKFVETNERMLNEFDDHRSGKYFSFSIPRGEMHRFFRSEFLRAMEQRVKELNFQEERALEQMLTTDNANRSDLIIIDRQVRNRGRADQTQIDMLALIRSELDDYQFCVLEVKLGNNPELRGKVFRQLEGYVDRVSKHFNDYKECYEENLKQKQELGLIDRTLKVNIVRGVSGLVVVVGYSGIAQSNIRQLKEKAPNVKVFQLVNIIDLTKAV